MRSLARAIFTILLLTVVASCTQYEKPDGEPCPPDGGVGVVGEEIRGETFEGTVEPERTEGAPYPPAKPGEGEREPNSDQINYPPVPEGPRRGDMRPANAAVRIVGAFDDGGEQPPVLRDFEGGRDDDGNDDGPSQDINFDDFEEVDDVLPALGSLGEVSVAENGRTVMMTGNTWMALSEDGGANFTYINPTTVFPQSDNGLCCDQVLLYVPRHDLFVWLLQYWSATGPDGTRDNRLRVAVQTTQGVRDSNGTAWTYWDFLSNVYSAGGSLDYNDMTATNTSLYWTSMIAGGRVVARIPLAQLAAGGTVNYRYTGGTNAVFSHITQNPDRQVYWGGHVNTSQLRVYNWPEGDNSYYWRTININSWPNDSESSVVPGGTNWMQWEGSITTYIYGNALLNNSVWLAWQAGRGGGFPHPHVQMIRLNASTFALQGQVQVWNPDFAFQDAFLSTAGGELGMSIAFGGGPFHASHAVGVWGDFVVYYPTLSTRSTTRWGDYNTSRRSGSDPDRWVAGGYTLTTDGSGTNITVPHFLRFGR